MDILKDLQKLYDKWESKAWISGDDWYEEAVYECLDDIADIIETYKKV
jgi:hypothetical protein